jgi:hypothetical protein
MFREKVNEILTTERVDFLLQQFREFTTKTGGDPDKLVQLMIGSGNKYPKEMQSLMISMIG